MKKIKYLKKDGRLYTQREVREEDRDHRFKKVVRDKSEIQIIDCFGRFDAPCREPDLSGLTAKHLRSRKVRKDMMAAGLIW